MANYNPALHEQGGYKRGLESLLYRKRRTLGRWRVETNENVRTIYHYSTAMLSFLVDNEGKPVVQTPGTILHMSTGQGSVSDQQGMNRLFRQLQIPFYFVRKGGADITCTDSEWVMWLAGGRTHARLYKSVDVRHVIQEWGTRYLKDYLSLADRSNS